MPPNEATPGWHPDEIALSEPTRASRLRWVIVVNAELPAGVAANAAACLAAQTGSGVSGLLGPGGTDADGRFHPGLPWAGCTVLAAPPERLALLHHTADDLSDVWMCDMPASAQTNRVYADYLEELASTPADGLRLRALSLVGPRKQVAKLTSGLGLLP